MLKIDGTIVATGCFVDNHITRIYVLPEHQKKGYGTFIMKNIEVQISEKYDKEYRDASLPAAERSRRPYSEAMLQIRLKSFTEV